MVPPPESFGGGLSSVIVLGPATGSTNFFLSKRVVGVAGSYHADGGAPLLFSICTNPSDRGRFLPMLRRFPFGSFWTMALGVVIRSD